MAKYVQGQSKTSFVREVLNELGAVVENPPIGWKKKVEEALAAENLKMNQVTIYQTRLKMIKAKSGVAKPAKPANGDAKKPLGRPANADKALTMDELVKIRDFAKSIGGIARLTEGLKFIQAFAS